ncbi:MAG: acetyl-CoA carboxylase biotin carboxyl carrier protein subunit [Bacteroidetes bacterium]|nr:acetyl-CoA carboxylase biotin carboxyl carrier protein subunit [Bacteroidota bacterium]
MEDLVLKIEDKEYYTQYDKNDYSTIKLNGKPFQVELLKKYGENIFSFAVNQRLLQVELVVDENQNLIISFDGLSYQIDVTNETKKMLAKFVQTSATGAGVRGGQIKAPMPGMVVKILIEPGIEVHKGDSLLIVEAMKMENALKSPFRGKVKSIKVNEGEAVEKDALLMELEPF